MRSTCLAIVFTVFAVGSSAQTADAPAFEVATIKPSDGSTPMSLQRVGNRILTSNVPLSGLIEWSFELDDDRLIGRQDTTDVTAVRDRPSLFTAIGEQLGLRLEPRRRDFDVVVVDHVDSIPTQRISGIARHLL